jgi:Ca2+/Na+ antiporter
MGNITGAMVFQSAIPVSVALLLAGDQWRVTSDSWLAFASAGMSLLAVAAVFGPMARRGRLDGKALLVGGGLYVVYLALVGAELLGLLPKGG